MRLPKLIFFKLFISLLLSACFATLVAAQKGVLSTNDFKQLAGTAEEIPAMRLPNPADLGTNSKTAMIRISSDRKLQNIEIPVETAGDFKIMLLAPNSANWKINLTLPNKESLDLRQDANRFGIERTQSEFGVDGEQFPAEVYSLGSVAAGVLQVKINTGKLSSNAETAGYLVISSESPYRLHSYVNTLETIKGKNVGLVASLFDNATNDKADFAGNIRQATARIETPNGEVIETQMFDDGNHGDLNANDGIFGSDFVPNQAGKYAAQIMASGETPNGEKFLRTGEHIFSVAETAADFYGDASVKSLDENRLRFDLPVQGLKTGQKVLAHAEVWGRDGDGNEKAIAWIGGMTLAQSFGRSAMKTVSLTLDERWLTRSDAADDYELRNVRIQDTDTFVTLGTANKIALPEIALPEKLRSSGDEITDEMRMGARPASRAELNAPGGKLLLVHGYCSSDVWATARANGNFTNYATFLDLNQNRSNDQFAQRIRDFGAQFPSFGIVAHSQGGAASLHLYTYYWSGLDNATGSRLIQSVGTPYQGTAIAGNLAAIGSVFGAGCGSNTDLTYSGAAAWLANIPSWARAKVYYHTTSFEDVWWRYDYCSVATDLFLGDPEDGVVEKAYAQLSGANNLGHKTGWCHTSGMRDPAQTTDASRNVNMNTYAAR